MVDAKDRRLRENLSERGVQLLRRSQIAPEWFFHHHARLLCEANPVQSDSNGGNHAGRNREIVQWPLRVAERLPQAIERTRVAVIAVDVLQQRAQSSERLFVDAAVMFET